MAVSIIKNVIRGALLLTSLWLALPAWSVIDVYEFDNEVDRQRYQSFIEEMRCPKCQNQNLAGSDSPISSDLRRELYRLLQEGKSDREIVDFMVSRYGDYVLYRPKLQSNTLLLWGLPLGLLLAGIVVVSFTVRQRRKASAAAPLSENEQQRLKQLLQKAAEREPKP